MPGDDVERTNSIPLNEGLRALAIPEAPPPHLEERVVATLAGRDALRRAAPRPPWHWLVAAAAAVLLFVAGLLFGSGRDEPAAGPRYALVLLGGPGYVVPTPEQEAVSVARHGAWAGRLHEADRLVLAEKLGPTLAVLSAAGAAAGDLAATGDLLGVFIIVAASDDAAIEIARSSPHVMDGGRVAVIRIEPT